MIKRWTRLLLLVGILGILPAAVVATTADQGRVTGQNGNVIALIDGQPVTLESYHDQLQLIVQNLAYMEQQARSGAPNAPEILQFMMFIDDSGIQNVALGSLIVERALYARAIADGHAATSEEIDIRVAQDRALVEGNPEVAAQVASEIDAHGEERFWSVVYPAIIERDMTIGKLWNAEQAVAGEFDARVVSEASINLIDPEAVAPATLQGALTYLNTYWEMRR